MANERDFVVRLRAEDYTTKPIGDALAAVQKLVAAVNEQVDASKRGTTTTKDFNASVTSLQIAVGALVNQKIALHEAQIKEAEYEEKTRQVIERRMALQKALANLQEGTSQKGVQADAINALGASIRAAEKQAETARLAFEKANGAVRFLGLSTDDYAASQARLAEQLKVTNAALDAAGNAKLDFGPNKRKADAEAAAQKKADADAAASRKAREDAEDKARQHQEQEERELTAQLLAATKARETAIASEAKAKADAAKRITDIDARLLASIVSGQDAQTQAYLNGQRAIAVADAEALDRQITQAKAKEALAERFALRQQEAAARGLVAAQKVADANKEAGTPSGGNLGAVNAVRGAFTGLDTSATINTGDAVNKLDETLKASTVTAKQYAETLVQTQRVGKRLAEDAGLLESLEKQQKALAKTNAEYERYEAELQRLVAVKKRTAESDNDLARAQSQVEGTAARLQKETEAYNRLLVTTRARGIDEKNLSAEMAKQVALAARLEAVQGRVKNSKGFLGLDSFQLQNLSFQINDVVTQLSLGQGLLRTLESQGGQIFQIFNIPISSLLRYLPLIGAVVGAVGLAVAAFSQLKEREDALRGFEGRLKAMADGGTLSAVALLQTQLAIEKLGVSFEDAGAAVNLFIEKGIRPDRMVQFAKAAQDIADVFGGDFKDRIKEVTSGLTGNFEAIEKLNESLGFLTAAERRQIKEFYDNGEAAKGQTLALEILAKKNDEAAARSRSEWSVAVRDLTAAWREFVEYVSGIKDSDFLKNTVSQVRELAGFLRALGQLSDRKITAAEFGSTVLDLLNGTVPVVDKTKDAINSTKKDIEALVTQLEKAKGIVQQGRAAGLTDEEIGEPARKVAELEARLFKARETLNLLSAQVTPEGETRESLSRRLAILERDRDKLGNPSAGSAVQSLPVPPQLLPIFKAAAERTGIALEVLLAQAMQESGFDMKKIGSAGEIGIGQIKPSTAARPGFGVTPIDPKTLSDPEVNINFMADYLKGRIGTGSVASGLKNYNGGGDPNYLQNVSRYLPGGMAGGLATKEIDDLRAKIAALDTAAGKAAPAVGVLTANTEQSRQAADRLSEILDKENKAQADATLRGRVAEARDAEREKEFRATQVNRAGPEFGQATPEGQRVTAAVDESVRIYREKLAAERDEKQKSDDQALKSEQARARAEYQAMLAVQRDFQTALSALKTKAGQDDKTDAEAQRRAIQDAYDIQIAKLKEDAKRTGTAFIGGIPKEQYFELLEKAKNDALANATADAAVAAVQKVTEERTQAYARIQADFKAGLITISETFARVLETTDKFAPRVATAVATARKNLEGQPDTAANRASGQKVNDAASPGVLIGEEQKTINTGLENLNKISSARSSFQSLQRTLVAQGVITTEEGVNRVKKFYAEGLDAGKKAADDLEAALDQIQSGPGKLSEENFNKAKAAVAQFRGELSYVDPEMKKLRETIVNSFTNRIVEAFDTVAQSVGNFLAGTASLKDVFASVGSAFATMTAGILKDIATMILRTLILKAVQAGLNAVSLGTGDAVVAAAKVATAHSGQMVGSPGGQSRVVDFSVFANARRMHNGGLASDEVPTILQRGEQVLSKTQVRAQAGAAGGANASGSTGIRNVLAVGDKEIASAMTGQHGERVIMNVLRRNSATVRKWV